MPTETRTIYPAVRIVVQSKTVCSPDCPRLWGIVGAGRCKHPAGHDEDLRGTYDKPVRRPWCRRADTPKEAVDAATDA